MDLSVDIEQQIVEYLNIEYGVYKENEKINVSDLCYEGVRVVDGKYIRFWKYPCSKESGCWATVEKYEDGFLISIANILPKKEK